MPVEPWSPSAFEERYQQDPDPWDFATSTYEQGRYRVVLGALWHGRYDRAYEPGCSVGEFTVLLAERCNRLVATDVSPTAVARARARCATAASAQVHVGSVTDPPPADLDLVVFSELGYYFTTTELEGLVRKLGGSLRPGGELVACHWLGSSPDHRLDGREVHDVLRASLPAAFTHRRHEEHPGFLIDAWSRP